MKNIFLVITGLILMNSMLSATSASTKSSSEKKFRIKLKPSAPPTIKAKGEYKENSVTKKAVEKTANENGENKENNEKAENKEKEESSWKLVWSDEFDGNRLDENKWSYWENGNPWKDGNYVDENGNLVDQYGFNVKQYYLRENVKVKDGNLIITIKKENDKTVKIDGVDRKILYSSGAVHTKDKYSVKYGKIEMRAILPKGVGTWPAFWTWPEGYVQSAVPAKEEIDIVEVYGSNLKKVTGTAHILKSDNTYQSYIGKDLRIKKNEDLAKYNIYAVEWDDKEIKWFFNGRNYKTLSMKKVKKDIGKIFDLRHFLMINVALENKTGEDGDVEFPTEMIVDYVRVYQK